MFCLILEGEPERLHRQDRAAAQFLSTLLSPTPSQQRSNVFEFPHVDLISKE